MAEDGTYWTLIVAVGLAMGLLTSTLVTNLALAPLADELGIEEPSPGGGPRWTSRGSNLVPGTPRSTPIRHPTSS